jgi:hypothetical protein
VASSGKLFVTTTADAAVGDLRCGGADFFVWCEKVGHSKPFRVTRGSYDLLFFPFAFAYEPKTDRSRARGALADIGRSFVPTFSS